MDKNTKYIILALVGGVGVYIIWRGGYFQQWFPSLFGPTVPTPTKPTPQGTQPGTPKPPATPPPVGPTTPAVGTIYSDSAGNKYQWTGTGWKLITAANTPTPPPPPVNTPPTPPALSTLQQIQSLAQQSGQGPLLNADEWAYYAGQLGVAVPDPGSIDPDLYAGAWGPGTDRTTPIAADTFWYLATTTDPSLSGLAGLVGGGSRWLT